MKVTVHEMAIEGPRLIEPDTFTDHRGFFYESYSARRLAEQGIDLTFVQDNQSRSRRGVVRGLHYQGPAAAQWRLVRCTVGEIFDVIVDLQVGSPTFGHWLGVRLSEDNQHQLLIPPAFAHGFVVLSESADVHYKCSNFHDVSAERSLSFWDPELAIELPLDGDAVVSDKDRSAPSFAAYRAAPDFPDAWDESEVHP